MIERLLCQGNIGVALAGNELEKAYEIVHQSMDPFFLIHRHLMQGLQIGIFIKPVFFRLPDKKIFIPFISRIKELTGIDISQMCVSNENGGYDIPQSVLALVINKFSPF